jgi:Flp pilus assembly protein CpaB
VGVALVCISVLVGARVLASADDTVAVLAANRSLVAGQRLTPGDLTEVRLRFGSDEDADRYLAADEEVPDGVVLLRPVGPGELVPRAALGTDQGGLVELPLSLDPGRVPASVHAGSVVDVWVTGDGDGRDGGGGPTERLLSQVPVLSVSRSGGLGSSGLRQVVVGIPTEDESRLSDVVDRLHGSLLVVRRPG